MSAPEAITTVYREERGRLLATLIRLARNLDDAEEVLQEAFARAARLWPDQGIPARPAGWILEVARNLLLDQRRGEKRRRELLRELIVDRTDDTELADDVLRLIFTCCHPVLSLEAQIALTLRTVGGLTTPEIARAFLLPEATLAQRIVRAKAKIRDAGVPYRIPTAADFPERLTGVLLTLYLIFNEGYSQHRHDLAAEALRLGRLLLEWLPGQAEVEGLVALMTLHHARRTARLNAQGDLIPLDEQDRSLWQAAEIATGRQLVEQALRRRQLGPYQLQAAIAAAHTEGPDWPQVALLYNELLRFDASPIVRLNHAVAVGLAGDVSTALSLLNDLHGLDAYAPWHAARAQMLKRAGEPAAARAAFGAAIRLSHNRAEREYLSRQQAAIAPPA